MNRTDAPRRIWTALGARVERFADDRAVRQALAMRPRRGLLAWIFAVTLTLFAIGLHLHVRFEVVRLGYATSQAKARLNSLKLKDRALRLELATLTSPARIERDARERLGMDVADYSRIVFVSQGRTGSPIASGKVR